MLAGDNWESTSFDIVRQRLHGEFYWSHLMRIVQITPGAGKMICGACLRDHALTKALQKAGHSALLVPLYLPASLDGESEENAVFFTGINVYLEEKWSWFRNSPRWLHRFLASKWLLKRVAGMASGTHASELGEMTLSMLRGEEGNQVGELNELVAWLKTEKPDVVCLGNALLIGLARQIRHEVKTPVICSLQGEDYYLDSLKAPFKMEAWKLAIERAADVDLFIAPSHYFGELMRKRLQLRDSQVTVVENGIDLSGFGVSEGGAVPTIGFFARMCKEKGLDVLVDAFVALKQRNRIPGLRLRVGGYCGPTDRLFVEDLKSQLQGYEGFVDFCPNLSRSEKLIFLKSLSVFSVPAVYSEAFGLYILEAMAAGVPVVEPNHAAFPELINLTGGGILYCPEDSGALADSLEKLLLDPNLTRRLGGQGRKAVFSSFSIEAMASKIAIAYAKAGEKQK